ncbi:peroxidase isoform X2 [Sitodiplosis mosellana]|uniref:peroxidase isoform X2 n=1 Tax=Sitodiplosis mosellana TaxID=263140 RepID=UPI002444801B|nr:peroxidase isoform X2 [Sitodiplosis mosellana]XP_055315122.1 peroxidase isoform X2 [Sitodiplosis mosellana]
MKRIIIVCFLVSLIGTRSVYGGLFDFLTKDNGKENGGADKKVTFTEQELSQAIDLAEFSYNQLKTMEESISNSRIQLSNTSSSYAQYLESLPNNYTMEYDKIAQIVLKASKYLLNNNCKKAGLDDNKCVEAISTYTLPKCDLLDKCEQLNETKSSINSYRRLLPAHYADGLSKMFDLPSPKNISNSFFELTRPDMSLINEEAATYEGVVDEERNVALVQWSQFIEHDLVRTVFQIMSNGNPIECCAEDATNAPPRYRHPACAPLMIDVNGEDYNRLPSCLNYVRSALNVNANCSFGPAQQINQASNYLDLSQLYGNTDEITDTLRSFNNGELKISNDPLSPTLPEIEDIESNHLCMHNTTIDTVCYRAGDSRVNVNPYVTTLYTLFLRSHNRIAKQLKKEHPTWNDAELFAYAKRINVGIYQQIVYGEWLNIVLGLNEAAAINRNTTACNLDGKVSNEFATAGIRFYYSMMPGDLKTTKDVSYFIRQNNIIIRPMTEENILKLKDEYYKPRDLAEDEELENIIDAIVKQKAMAMDTGYVADVAKHYYRFQNSEQKDVGTDVLALDILRGRDHGLHTYKNYLELCTKTPIQGWSDFRSNINHEDLERLKQIYASYDQVDLIIGAIAERPKPGATVGETFSCIIGEQLSNTRCSDKDFYTVSNDPIFKQFVDNYSGAKLICDTTRLTSVPRNIFHVPSEKNPMIYCKDI